MKLALAIALVALLLAGCTGTGTGGGGQDVNIEPAPIHEVRVSFSESSPPQVMLYVKGGLRDGCTTFNDLKTDRAGNTVKVTVTTRRPSDQICTEIYTYFERNVNLGTNFTSGQKYTVDVNGTTTTFTMP